MSMISVIIPILEVVSIVLPIIIGLINSKKKDIAKTNKKKSSKNRMYVTIIVISIYPRQHHELPLKNDNQYTHKQSKKL